ncbi:MAG TPA: alkaline phosphatase PhoX [Acidimicrobiales bacterium]|nr:alkaline phosphatase PhoX [Acidimicrobiales bacterium]
MTVYDWSTGPTPMLSGVDNVVASRAGEIFVAEDGGDMQLVTLRPDGWVTPFLQYCGTPSELTGPTFDPSGKRLYVSVQENPGITFGIEGPLARSL